MTSDAGRRWVISVAPVACGMAPFLVIVVVALAHVGRPGISAGDYAFIEMATRRALDGDALVGPYSRFAWNHPGPAMFYWFAPFFGAFGQRPESLGLAAAVANAGAAGVAVATAAVASGRRAAWTVAGGLAAMVLVWGSAWIDRIWNPFLVLTPLLATGFLVAAVLAGHRWSLVPLVAVATFVVQSHVGTAPILGLLGVATAVGVGRSLRTDWRPWRGPFLATVGAGAAMWALPVYEQLSGHPGNLGQLVHFLRTSESSHSLGEVLDKVSVQLTLSKVGLISNVVSSTRPLPPATPARLLVLGLLLGTVAVGLVRHARAGRRFEQHLCLVALLGTAGAVASGLRVAGELEGYLTMPATAVGALLWASVLLTVVAEASEGADRLRRPLPARGRNVGAGVMAVACLGVALIVATDDPARALQVPPHPDRAAVVVTEQLRAAVGPETDAVLLLLADASAASTGGLLANQLERDGVTVRADPRWEHYVGRSRRSDGCEQYAVRVGTPGAGPASGQGPVIATFADRAIQGRRLHPPERCL